MTCNIGLEKRQLLEVEKADRREEMSRKTKLGIYRQIKSCKNTERPEGLLSQITFGILPTEIGRYRTEASV